MRVGLTGIWCFVAAILITPGARTQDLEIWTGEKRSRVERRQREDQTYCNLSRLVSIVGLHLEESEKHLILRGPRGTLKLEDGRRLVGLEDQHILLSGPSWKRRARDWYVTQDFLDKALPLILDRKIEKMADDRYRLEKLFENHVQVKVGNYTDHVRIVFVLEKSSSIRVREFPGYIQLEFTAYRVRAILPSTQPDFSLVASIGLNPHDLYGVFRIYKGKSFDHFREYSLEGPSRKVIDVYARPAAADSSGPVPDSIGSSDDQEVASFSSRPDDGVLTIDPGHGGANYGVHPSQELLEKTFALQISKQLEKNLQESGYRVLLTRKRDVDLPVEQRSSIANHYKSRIYLSIHLGGSAFGETHGPVVYIHRFSRAKASAVDLKGIRQAPDVDAAVTKGWLGEGFQLSAWENGQLHHLGKSRELAQLIQNQLNDLFETTNRVVEAPLAGLAPVMAPAVLIEAGFLTHEEEGERLKLHSFQCQIAEAMTIAVQEFLEEY